MDSGKHDEYPWVFHGNSSELMQIEITRIIFEMLKRDQFDLEFFDLSRVFSRLQSFPELSFKDRENRFGQVSSIEIRNER